MYKGCNITLNLRKINLEENRLGCRGRHRAVDYIRAISSNPWVVGREAKMAYWDP